MNLRRNIDVRTACIILVILFPLMLVFGMSLNPQIRNQFILSRYLKGMQADWNSFKTNNPEFRDLDLITTSRPDVLISSKVSGEADLKLLEEFFRGHRPPESTPVHVVLDIERSGLLVNRYHVSFPSMRSGQFTLDKEAEQDIAPSDR